MRPRVRRVAVLLLVAGLLAGCRREGGDRPPEIRYGEETCSRCRMIISEEAFAAAMRRADGSTEVFDDPGCLIALWERERAAGAARLWLHDHRGGGWLPVASAYLVESPELITPMGSGLVAFDRRDRALAFAQERGGRVLTWEEVMSRHRERGD